ncbi:MAG: hypothetical protein EOP60_08355 [Sphingomonadales bacterium]|nr:MAG: hypothetical protein EOP60_08355 [Sphingomonadales bacterium]
MVLAGQDNQPAAGITGAPAISIGNRWRGQDRADMAALVAEAISLILDPKTIEYGRSLKADYPRAWFSTAAGYGDAERVTMTVGRPAAPLRYLAATVVPARRWARTVGVEGRIQIKVSRKLLDRWRSGDVVMRSCAINTMAHEISHTLSDSATRYRAATTDTDVGEAARLRPPASYLTGDIAQCGYLIRNGRIAPAGLRQCVAVWYRPEGFQSGRCTSFPGDTPIG